MNRELGDLSDDRVVDYGNDGRRDDVKVPTRGESSATDMDNGPDIRSGCYLDRVRHSARACSLLKRPENTADLFGNKFVLANDPVDDAQDQEPIIRDPHGVAKILPSPRVLNDPQSDPISPASMKPAIAS